MGSIRVQKGFRYRDVFWGFRVSDGLRFSALDVS